MFLQQCDQNISVKITISVIKCSKNLQNISVKCNCAVNNFCNLVTLILSVWQRYNYAVSMILKQNDPPPPFHKDNLFRAHQTQYTT